MARKAQDVTEAELAILQQLWAEGPTTVKGLSVALYGKATTSSTATVQKLLGRLESKGCVDRDLKVWPRLFQASIDRADLIRRRLQNTADELCQGSLGLLLTHLVTHSRLTQSDRCELRSLLENLPAEKR